MIRKQFPFFVILFLSFQILTLHSQSSKRYFIASVNVEGHKFADPQTIITISGLNIGDSIRYPNDPKISKAIINLWQRQQFSDVQILADNIIGDNIFLTIKVEELPRINSIRIENNKEVSTEALLKAINKNIGDLISPYEIFLIKERIRKKYKDEGRHFVRVEVERVPTYATNYYDLVIKIDEGIKYRVKSISFFGNNSFDDERLKGTFEETKTKHWWQFWTSDKFEPNNYEKDKELLIKFYRNNGFVDFEILKDTIIYDDQKEQVHIHIFVHEGKKFYVRNIYFIGATVFPSELLQKRLDISKGDVYNHEKFQQNLYGNKENTDAMSLYFDNGYLFARNEIQEIRIGPDSLDIYIRVYEGNRVTINKVDIVGNTKTKDKVIRRELFTYPGDRFSRAAIINSIRALGRLNYFNPENLRPEIKMVDNTKVDVIYKVEERSTDTFNASVGFAGSLGLTGAIGFSFNNFSISEPLKGGAGQILNLTLEFGQAYKHRTFSLGFTEPWLFDTPTTIGFNIFDQRILHSPIDLQRRGIGVNLGRRLRWPDDYFRIDGGLRFQKNKIGSAGYSQYYRQGTTTELTLNAAISRISLDNLFFPTSGSRFTISTDFSTGALGIGNTDFLKSEMHFEINQTLFKINEIPRIVLNMTSKWGYIAGIKSDTNINPIELFYMGGTGLSSGFPITPLRGYPDQSIGPRGGGKILARHFAELRFALSLDPMPIYFYGFVEAGNVWSEPKRTDPFNLKRSAGVGVQIFLQALGIIGFSYGFGFDKTDDTGQLSGWRFLFHIGQ
ncbi:MAG: outer membrane protein assembly factor BamA [Ignavibacteria bacterium]|nr:outer membrane protein assembly factor BamA [Ignavibacteria bacterium]